MRHLALALHKLSTFRVFSSQMRWILLQAAIKLLRTSYSPEEIEVVQTRHGFPIGVFAHTWSGSYLVLERVYCEPEISSIIMSVLRPGMTFVDIGANIGYYTLLAASIVGPPGSVYAVEANPRVSNILRKNVLRAGFGNIRVVAGAAWDCEQSLWIRDELNDPGKSHCHSQSGDKGSRPATTQVIGIPLDTVLSGDCHLVKLDVEGAELRALRGMVRVIERFKPDLIVEVTPRFVAERFGYETGDIWRFLEQFGYVGYNVAESRNVIVRPDQIRYEDQINVYFTVR